MTKILIIEDHDDMHDLPVVQVEMMGFMALSGKNGTEGVKISVAENPI